MLLSAQSMPVVKIAEVTFSSADRVRNVIHNFNAHSFESFYPKCKAAVPGGFTLPERRGLAKSKPVDHGLPFSTWSPAKPTDFLVAEGVVDDSVSFQRVKTWKTSRDPAGTDRPATPRRRGCSSGSCSVTG